MPAVAVLLGLLLLTTVVALIWYWVTSFVFLMCLTDEEMPGRYDKILWYIVFFTMWVFAPFILGMWRKA